MPSTQLAESQHKGTLGHSILHVVQGLHATQRLVKVSTVLQVMALWLHFEPPAASELPDHVLMFIARAFARVLASAARTCPHK